MEKDIYTTTIVITEPNLNDEFVGAGYEYIVRTTQPFSFENLMDTIYQALEIERIYKDEVFLEIIKERNGEYLDRDECVLEIDILLTDEPSEYIDWNVCNNAMPFIYKIDREKSSIKFKE